MISVAGRPILERLVLHLVGYGVRHIYISTNYLAEVIEAYFGDGAAFGCVISYLREETALGTGGALSLLPRVPSDPLLVLNGDLVTQADIGALLQSHEQNGNDVTVGVQEYSHAVPYGCVEADGDRLLRMEEKPVLTRLVNAGIYVLAPAVVRRVPPNTQFPITALIEQCLQLNEPVGIFRISDDWIDVGQPEQLRRARGKP